jgi:hypothetical protein
MSAKIHNGKIKMLNYRFLVSGTGSFSSEINYALLGSFTAPMDENPYGRGWKQVLGGREWLWVTRPNWRNPLAPGSYYGRNWNGLVTLVMLLCWNVAWKWFRCLKLNVQSSLRHIATNHELLFNSNHQVNGNKKTVMRYIDEMQELLL